MNFHNMLTTAKSFYLLMILNVAIKSRVFRISVIYKQVSIDYISDWSVKWRLHFNHSKCVVMKFHSSSGSIFDYGYKIGSNFITSKDTHRDLGIILQTDLNWSNHYDHIYCKTYRLLSLLGRCFSSNNSISTKKKLYISLVHSQLTYCSQIWRPALIKDVKKLETLQRRATKFILGYHFSGLDYKDRLIQLKLLPLMYFSNWQICF